MAIQTINLTVPGGDTPRSANTKINANFSNSSHAASRLVGTATGNVMEVGAYGLGVSVNQTSVGTRNLEKFTDLTDPENVKNQIFTYRLNDVDLSTIPDTSAIPSNLAGTCIRTTYRGKNLLSDIVLSIPAGRAWLRGTAATGNWLNEVEIYTTGNTTKDTATGFLKASSPVLHVYNDSITKIHEAEQLDITVDKKGVGHYEIHGTTGLRKNDGWNMSPPRDVHGNVLCMVDLEEKDGVVILKTYKKLFDFETVSIVHDYDNPMDIPEGVCVEFRFNDLPYDDLDDIQTEV